VFTLERGGIAAPVAQNFSADFVDSMKRVKTLMKVLPT
jgi:hypothetical protein